MVVSVTLTIEKNRFHVLERLDFTPQYNMMASYFIREMGRMFDTAGASRGHKWQELAPSTLIRKAKRGQSTEILQGRGRLRASFRALRVNEEGLIFGTDVAYAKYHDSDKPRQQAKRGGPKLPQRKLLRALPRDAERLGVLVREAIETAAGGEA